MERRDLMVLALTDEDDARHRLGLTGTGRHTQVPANLGEDDAVADLARLKHRGPNRAARVDRVEIC